MSTTPHPRGQSTSRCVGDGPRARPGCIPPAPAPRPSRDAAAKNTHPYKMHARAAATHTVQSPRIPLSKPRLAGDARAAVCQRCCRPESRPLGHHARQRQSPPRSPYTRLKTAHLTRSHAAHVAQQNASAAVTTFDDGGGVRQRARAPNLSYTEAGAVWHRRQHQRSAWAACCERRVKLVGAFK
jgi:hypothetical protein